MKRKKPPVIWTNFFTMEIQNTTEKKKGGVVFGYFGNAGRAGRKEVRAENGRECA